MAPTSHPQRRQLNDISAWTLSRDPIRELAAQLRRSSEASSIRTHGWVSQAG